MYFRGDCFSGLSPAKYNPIASAVVGRCTPVQLTCSKMTCERPELTLPQSAKEEYLRRDTRSAAGFHLDPVACPKAGYVHRYLNTCGLLEFPCAGCVTQAPRKDNTGPKEKHLGLHGPWWHSWRLCRHNRILNEPFPRPTPSVLAPSRALVTELLQVLGDFSCMIKVF